MGLGFQRRSAESGWVWAAIMPSAVPDLAKALLGLVREVHRLTALRKADLELHEDNAARVAELEAENTKLRKCVGAADAYVEAVVRIEDSPAMQGVYSIAAVHHYPYNGANWSGELAQYRAARAEVDKP